MTERIDNRNAEVTAPSGLVGQILLDRYEIVRAIGEGGWGIVYEARHLTLNKRMAVKVLHSHLCRNKENLARFEREAQIAGALQHPNLATVHDFGKLPSGQPVLVMDYYEGVSLSGMIDKETKLEEARMVPLFLGLCEGLAAAHEKGCLHRDIKPGNILVVQRGGVETAVLMDFGLAKLAEGEGADHNLTKTGETLGTPHYMSPEQCVSKNLDARSDIYSLGCVMYESLTGEAPFSAESVYECMHKHLEEMPTPFKVRKITTVSPALEQIVMHCLQKNPADRPQTANELRELLVQLQSKGKIRGGIRKSHRKPKNNHLGISWKHLAGGAIAIGVVALLGFTMFANKPAPQTSTTSAATASATGSPSSSTAQPGTPMEQFQRFAQQTISQDQAGNFDGALVTATKAMEISESKFGRYTPANADAHYVRGLVLQHQGRYQQAIDEWKTSLDIKEKLFGHDNPPAVMAYLEMGRLYEMSKQPDEAKKCFSKAEAIRKKLGIH